MRSKFCHDVMANHQNQLQVVAYNFVICCTNMHANCNLRFVQVQTTQDQVIRKFNDFDICNKNKIVIPS